jgi:translation initiation factor IF-3
MSSTANPPVCKIVDYGKHKYLESKTGRDKKPKQQEVKGIKISPRIAEHDMDFLSRNAMRFLEEGHKVKVTCVFKAREITHPELGRKKLDLFAERVIDYGTVERTPTLDGRMMVMILTPKKDIAKKKDAKDQDKQDGGKEIQGDGVGKDHAPSVAQQPPVPSQEGISEETA